MLELWHAQRRAGARLTPAMLARVKGQVYAEHPALFQRRVALSKKRSRENLDPTFKGTHPMFRRLARSGWYRKGHRIRELQLLADGLRRTRGIARSKPLTQVEYLAFDLEATNVNAGRLDKKRGRFHSGWDEVTQFGYSVYRGGRKVRSGTIDIRPDVPIAPEVRKLTKLDADKLRSAPRFEQAAKQILELMQGRVLIGQSAAKHDWAWLQSNFRRLGVNLPGPRGLVLDTYLLSFNTDPGGRGLVDLARQLDVRGRPGHVHHHAGHDAELAGDVFFSMMLRSRVRTLGDAFALQAQGDAIKHRPRN
jgi:DNA polymerase III epsilon subunit-like protein